MSLNTSLNRGLLIAGLAMGLTGLAGQQAAEAISKDASAPPSSNRADIDQIFFERTLLKERERARDESSRTQENQAASKLLEKAQIARIQPANVINTVAHHAEALDP